MLFDEFGHATLPGFVSVANTIRGYRVSLSIILQSISQLSARYGQDCAKSIQGGFNSYLTYSGSDPETARFFEGLSGRVIEHQEARDEHETVRHHEHNLLNADSIRRIGEDEAILISGNRHPARLRTLPYFKSGRFLSASKQPPAGRSESRSTGQVKWVPIFGEKVD
ncbi:MAG: type IV secretory system conjugative DNA transfer family protein [Dinoroseobacter sp.]|nr:type IV secretory system conjugative DNA transfer family protein [Dinoroseobacter sp.]